ncbi:MAG: hypothetical protein FWF51_04585 [Chitinivibrionia bacterium]|nr:hypothetical protein [Chitinivibrionia bacterium]
MKIDVQNTIDELNAICLKIGAKETDWTLDSQWKPIDDFLEKLETEGIISGKYDIRYVLDNFVCKDGTFGDDNRKFFIYINSRKDIYSLPKFHIAKCKTLQDAIKKGNYNKYVYIYYSELERKDGRFKVNIIRDDRKVDTVDVKLEVCKNCLSELNYKNYNYKGFWGKEKDNIFNTFSIKEFIELYTKTNIKKPKYSTDTAPINNYPTNWDDISHEQKKLKKYTCEKCGINLESHQKFLDVHHKDTMKYNNFPENLEVLCLGCHIKEHPWMKNDIRYADFKELQQRKF